MSATVHWEVDRPGGLDDALIERAVEAALDEGGREGLHVGVILVDEPTLTRMHVELFDDPTVTDVISIDLAPDDDAPFEVGDANALAGELYVSVDRAREVAERRGVSLARETSLYVVHGVLHLCGHDDHDDDERARMRVAEQRVMRVLGFEDDALPHEED